MLLLSNSQIKHKYCYDNKMICLHYAAISGEMPKNLTHLIGITPSNTKYIMGQGPFKDFFISRNKQHLKGYQLSSQGIQYLLNSTYNERYFSFLITSNDTLIAPTTDVTKRNRYQLSAYLYYTLDVLDINYMPDLPTKNPDCYFYNSYVIKQNIEQKGQELHYQHLENFAIKGSRLFGCLLVNEFVYNVYILNKQMLQFNYNLELRAYEIINSRFCYEEKLTDNAIRTLMLTADRQTQKQVSIDILNTLMYPTSEDDSKYYFFRKINYKHLSILPIDSKKELYLLINQTEVNKYLDNKLQEMEIEQDGDESEKIIIQHDSTLNGNPVIYGYTLDVVKIKNLYLQLSVHNDLFTYIICTREQKDFYNTVFQLFDNVIILDDLLDDFEVKKDYSQ